MDSHPTVSITVPCYNQAHYLQECLASLRDQTYREWTAIVVDDASPDSQLIKLAIDQVGDRRIELVRHEINRGLAGSRNTGFRTSRTDLVVCVDADDKLDPFYLERLVPVLLNDANLDCAFSNVRLFGVRNEIVDFHVPTDSEIFRRQTVPGSGTLMRRRLWERNGGYDEAEVLRHGREDWEFYIRAFNDGCKAVHVAEPLYLYRINDASMNTRCRLNDHIIARYIYNKNRALFDSVGAGREFLCFAFSKACYASLSEGHRGLAFLIALQGWQVYPPLRWLKEVVKTVLPRWFLLETQRGRS